MSVMPPPCRITGDQSASVYNRNIRPNPEYEWTSFDRVRRHFGPHKLSRLGYDEEKCRNVLVRFCAHVPRNFQYKDGIQQVGPNMLDGLMTVFNISQIFLILRDHVGDENLDLAGGVLYELIEVDCEHTDDPGAAFQRWRHDHMYRYADLELPHIPHMTTITSSIIPTEKLTRWRLEHADRYRFVLSDSSPLVQRDYIASCIRSKKAWLIDHTLFVSSRSEGTHPMRSPNPKEFHEMQWNLNYGTTGRLIRERELPISLDRPRKPSSPETIDVSISPSSRSQRLRRSLSSISIIERIMDRLDKQKSETDLEQKRRSWKPDSLTLGSGLPLRDKRDQCEFTSIPLPKGRQVPNAIFARKFLIVDHGESLPSHLLVSQMPTAESKATETIVEAASTGLLNQASSWLFRGPFTPQLGFDGGLDYQWNSPTADISIRRFDIEASFTKASIIDQDHAPNVSEGARLRGRDRHTRSLHSLSKRSGVVFDLESTAEVKDASAKCDNPDEANPSGNGGRLLQFPVSPPHTPNNPTKSFNEMSDIPIKLSLERCGPHRRNTRLFDNIEFSIQSELHAPSVPVINRQTTIIERPSQAEPGL
ncbi:hypothetical protein GGS21DRAFT_546317 [Xylaria nigripes]|nr:hypothetical protein GGS21DRAFT_546317 [Xylaria nigripes]